MQWLRCRHSCIPSQVRKRPMHIVICGRAFRNSTMRQFAQKSGHSAPLIVLSDDLCRDNHLNLLSRLAGMVFDSCQGYAEFQNLPFINAILFLFRHTLNKDLGDIADAIRARRTKRLPVVLTRSEIDRLFKAMRGTNLLMARLIYGCGLRLAECVNLRVKDIDFEREAVTVRSGKGDKDRETVLPSSLRENLKDHLETVRLLYERDREKDANGVMMPLALEKKYPNAGKEWG